MLFLHASFVHDVRSRNTSAGDDTIQEEMRSDGIGIRPRPAHPVGESYTDPCNPHPLLVSRAQVFRDSLIYIRAPLELNARALQLYRGLPGSRSGFVSVKCRHPPHHAAVGEQRLMAAPGGSLACNCSR